MTQQVHAAPIRANSTTITIRWFVVGVEEFDLPQTLEAIQRAAAIKR